MTQTRVLLHPNDNGPFVPTDSDAYGGSEEAHKAILYTEYIETTGTWSNGVLLLPGYSYTAERGDLVPRYYTGYDYSQPEYPTSRLCGLEMSFKPVAANGFIDVTVTMQMGDGTPGSRIYLSFTKDPQTPSYNGMTYGGAEARDDTGNYTVFEELASGSAQDVIPVDFSQWQTVKILPTGVWSWTYGGGTRSGTFPAVVDLGGYMDIGGTARNMNDGTQPNDLGTGVPYQLVTGGLADIYIKDLAIWVYAEDVMFIDGDQTDVRRVFW